MKRFFLFPAALLFIPLVVSAQKLPNVQEASLRAPATIKVDGKSSEWNNQFQAYNKATEIFYTISNDNEKLYLTVQAKDLDIINKIICAGIIFTVNGSGKMKDEGGMAVTYPVLDRKKFPVNTPPIDLDNQYQMPADSFMTSLNKELISKAKDIGIHGIKEIKDTLISIYNQEGIKAAALFDDKTNFTYELAIPLKYLNLSVNKLKSLIYNIKLKSLEGGGTPVIDFSGPPDFKFSKAGQAQRRSLVKIISVDRTNKTGINSDRLLSLVNPTDFWGEYTLAK